MICYLLLDVMPHLEIRGVDYIDLALLEGTEEQKLLQDDVLFLPNRTTESSTNKS